MAGIAFSDTMNVGAAVFQLNPVYGCIMASDIQIAGDDDTGYNIASIYQVVLLFP